MSRHSWNLNVVDPDGPVVSKRLTDAEVFGAVHAIMRGEQPAAAAPSVDDERMHDRTQLIAA